MFASLWEEAGHFPAQAGFVPGDRGVCQGCSMPGVMLGGEGCRDTGAQGTAGLGHHGDTGTHRQWLPEQGEALAGPPKAVGAASTHTELAWLKQTPESQSLIDSSSVKQHWVGKSIFLVAWRTM